MNDRFMFYIIKVGDQFIMDNPLDSDEYKVHFTDDPIQAKQYPTVSSATAVANRYDGSIYQVIQKYALVNS